MSDCKRCGQCCIKVGPTFWTSSKTDWARAIWNYWRSERDAQFDDSSNPCQMLAMINGQYLCILEYLFGAAAKPDVCQQFPFEDGDCKGQTGISIGVDVGKAGGDQTIHTVVYMGEKPFDGAILDRPDAECAISSLDALGFKPIADKIKTQLGIVEKPVRGKKK